MSDKRLNAIKEIEWRVKYIKECLENYENMSKADLFNNMDRIDNILFDINDFINDLKEPNEAN